VSYFQTLQDVVAQGLPVTYASPYCTMGLYIPSLLDAYGFSTNNSIYIKPKEDGVEIGKHKYQ